LNNKLTAITASVGAVVLLGGTLLHPSAADPNVPAAAFAEYAADQLWLLSHLLELAGVALIVAALVVLGRRLASGPAADLASVAVAGAVASLALAGALQAVDGIALKATVDLWNAAPAQDKTSLFHSALAVRQIEIGLAAVSALSFGVTATLTGIALVIDRRYSTWLGYLGIAGGVPTIVAGLLIGRAGFSDTAMTTNLGASSLLLVWMIGIAVWLWRTAPATSRAD
jgi:uncharacterized membrane protein (DUF2068 family)